MNVKRQDLLDKFPFLFEVGSSEKTMSRFGYRWIGNAKNYIPFTKICYIFRISKNKITKVCEWLKEDDYWRDL